MLERAIGRHRRRPQAAVLRLLLPYVAFLALIGLILGLGFGLATHDRHTADPGRTSRPDAGIPSPAPEHGATTRSAATGSPLHVPGGVDGANPLGMLAPAGQPSTRRSPSASPPPSAASPSTTGQPVPRSTPPPAPSSTPAAPSAGERIIAEAQKYLGVPYVEGGASPSGFDSSGYTMWVYAQASVANLPHDADGQRMAMREISMAEARPGDLVFHMSRGRADNVAVFAGDGQQYAATPGSFVQLGPVWSSHIRVGTDWH